MVWTRIEALDDASTSIPSILKALISHFVLLFSPSRFWFILERSGK